jgi:phosphoglycerol transferase MdoB-like AlkP superfamily enzyme
MAEDKTKMLGLMRFWLFGISLILIATVLVVGIFIPGLTKELLFWVGVVMIGVLCAAWYFVYKWYLGRKEA